MNWQRILIFCLILCIVCSVSTVSAVDTSADDANDTLTTSKGEVVGVGNELSLGSSPNVEVLATGGGSFKDLNDLINDPNLASNPTIDLPQNYTYDNSKDGDYKKGIFFTKAMTIDGHGYAIDGNNLARIFGIGTRFANNQITHPGTDGPVTLKNIIFVNAFSNEGNQNEGFGAIEFYGDANAQSTLLLENCTFLNNRAPCAAALSMGYSYNNLVNITNCTFEGNTATVIGGGAIRLRNNVNNLKITDTLFKSNKALASDSGAIHLASGGVGTLIKNCTFESNNAYTMAGALSCSVEGLKIDNCSFISNSATQTNTGRAGAVYISGRNALINNSRFIDNYATFSSNAYGGGAIEIGSAALNTTINYCNFTGNHAEKSHGGAISSQNGRDITINNTRFEENYAASGGALFFENPTNLMMFNNTFKKNYVVGQFGGAIHFNSKSENVHLLNSSFISNTATKSNAGRGGAIRFDGSENGFKYFYIYNVDFIDNHARDEGGAFSHNQKGLYFYFENCTFINCTTEKRTNAWGGGMYFNAYDSSLKNITFINCSSQSGGSMSIKWSVGCKFENITIINSSASAYGGAVMIWDKDSVFANATIINTTCDSYGGAIAVSANYGSSPARVTLTDINITNSKAQYGGAIYLNGDYSNLNNINITKSSAINGGGIIVHSSENTFTKIRFNDSIATSNGGAMYINSDHQTIRNATFEGCNATNCGGAVYIGNYIYIYVHDSIFNNSYAYNGGAFYYAGSLGTVVSIHNSTFTNNNASHNGGAVYYVVVDDTGSDNKVIYRDYNNFDGEGDNSTGRTTLTMRSSAGSTYAKRIDDCYFKNNNDYKFTMAASSATDTVLGIVTISSPQDPNSRSFRVVVNITQGNRLVTQLILSTPLDYQNYFRPAEKRFIISTRENLTKDTEYNVSVGFEDNTYLYKEAKSSFKTANVFAYGDFKILQRLINEAIAGNGIVTLERDYIFTAAEDWGTMVNFPDDWCMNITSSITINGQGNSIDALGYSRIFNITGANVVINNVKLVNGNTSGIYNDAILHQGKTKAYGDGIQKGGAIFWAGENGVLNNTDVLDNFAEYGAGIFYNSTASNCKIANSSFSNNRATKSGGAIECNATKMNLTNTIFESNYAQNGSALCRESGATGGFGYNNTFIRNQAEIAGAALAWMKAENIYINNYTFIDNTAGFSGGAIYVGEDSTNCTVAYSRFSGNNVTSSSNGHGGAIEWYADTGNVINSTFVNNNAPTGGAIYVGGASGHINITQSGFLRNHAILSGGAIDLVASSVTVNNSYFRENTASNGGAIFVGGTGENNFINASYFTDNNATNGRGGAINWNASAGQIYDTNFTRNHADYGGAVYIGGSSDNSKIVNVRFTKNNATYNGGAIDWNATGGKLYNTTFISNYAGEYGAALCRESGATGGGGKNNTFISNHAGIAGAALGWINVNKISIDNYTFIDNTADRSGGAIYIGAGSDNCNIINCTFRGNNVTNLTGGHGGAVDIVADNATIKNSNFTNNNAFYGGAVFVGSASGNTNITNVTFTRNNANVDGGAINLQASGVRLNDTRFHSNNALRNGGALYVGGEGTTNVIYNSTFEDNRAENNGGAVYWRAHAGHIAYSNFTNWNTAINGGAIYLNGVSSNTNITHVIFRNNYAYKNGGAIDCNSTRMNLSYTLFESNWADEYGAALCREKGATSGFGEYNNFTSNYAGIAGAALAWLDVENININHYRFTDNIANQNGGAIYASVGSNNFTVNNCVFTGNNVTNDTAGHGGAIDIDSDNNTIKNSNFTNNNAFDGGALHIGSASGHTNITNVIFTKNGALNDGGAINLDASGVRLNDTKFYNNTAVKNGGALYVGGVGTTNTINNTLFDNNKAGSRGGAIDWLAKKGEITYSNFTRNSAESGGAIFLNGQSSESVLSHLIFENNAATKNGGAIDCNATLVNLTHTKFASNTAEFGGALCRESGAKGGFGVNNTFDKNHATKSGAALAWLGVENIKINNYTFTNNTADYSGGAIFVGPGSDNCQVHNCTFDENYISNAISGRGGAIDWIGNNGTVKNTTFNKCISINAGAIYVDEKSDNFTVKNSTFTECNSLTNGGALVLNGDNVTVYNSTFISCSGNDYGGAIAGFTSNNGNITDCYFKYNTVGIRISPQGVYYGEGGAIYWENSKNLTVKDSRFKSNAAHLSGGSISANNCSDSVVCNITTQDETAFRNGGSVAWLNSNNVTIKNSTFNDSGANYNGGSLYMAGVNATIKDTLVNYTWASWGRGGGLYVDGNVTLNNVTFNDTHGDEDNATAIYFKSGISNILNSKFANSFNSIGIAPKANVTIKGTNLTADDPNKTLKYLEDNSTVGVEKTKYAIWNDGELYLEKNNFDYVIFNNGTITSKTYLDVLYNQTWNVTWNETFTFRANITDDNNNSIISVKSLKTWNNHDMGGTFNMSYNQRKLNTYFQDVFIIYGSDAGLANCVNRSGTIRVKMPVYLSLTADATNPDHVVITATLTPQYKSNHTITDKFVYFKLGSLTFSGPISSQYPKNWTISRSQWELANLAAGTHMVTAEFKEDDYHLGVENWTTFDVHFRESWIRVAIANINYGETATALITTNSNATVNFTFHGRNIVIPVTMTKNPTTGYYEGRVDTTVAEYITTGLHDVDVVLAENEYYAFNTNRTSFEVRKLNTTVGATRIAVIQVGDKQVITVTVHDTYAPKNPTGFVNIAIGGETHYKKLDANGQATLNIYDLAKGEYNNYEVEYEGDGIFNGNSTKVSFRVDGDDDYNITVKVNDVKLGENATIYIVLPISVTNNLTVFVNNTKYENVTVKDGLAIVNVNTTVLNNPGRYVVNVTYPGDSVYALKQNNGNKFNVTATDDWTLNLNVVSRPYGENTVFTVTLPGNVATKMVNLTVDGEYHPVSINNAGVGTLTLNNLSGGLHSVVANYTGDARYVTKTNSTKFLVERAASTVTLTQNANGDVIATVLPTNVTGTVTFFVNERNYTVNLVRNVATLNRNNLTIGNNSIAVVYNGDINFTSSKNSTKFPIAKNPALVNVTATNETYGKDSTITVKVPTAQKGYVTITVNDTLINTTVKIENGEAKFDVGDLGVGRYIVNVTYLGDDSHTTEKNFTYFNITKATLTPVIIAQNVTVEENASFVISVNDDFKGKVKISVIGGTTHYDDGLQSLIYINKLPKGTYTANVTFYGDNNYTDKSVLVDFNVSAVEPTINVTIADATYPHDTNAIVKVSGYANGTVEIKVGENTYTRQIHNGEVTIPITGLDAGLKEASVKFTSADDYNTNVNTTYKFFINQTDSHIDINVTPESGLQSGDDVILNITVSCTGDVIVYVDGKENKDVLSNNRIVLNKNDLSVGDHTVVVYYPGDTNYRSSSASHTFTVGKHDSKVNVTVDSTVPYNEVVEITVETPKAQTGYVTITVNSRNYTAKLKDGVAKFNVTGLKVDKYTVNVTYEGNENYTVKDNSTKFEVTQISLKATVIGVNVTDAMNSTFVISVPDDYEGQLTITVDGETYTGNADSIIQMTKLTVGEKTAHVVFADDNNYKGTAFDVTFNITKSENALPVTTVVNSTTVVVTVPENVTGNVTVVLPNGTNKTVVIKNGSAIVTLENMTPGENNITVIYTDGNNTITTNATVTIPKYDSDMKVIVSEAKAGGNATVTVEVPVNATGTITVTIDGKTYTTDNIISGKATITIENLTAGNKTLIVEYSGNANYTANYTLANFTVAPGKVESEIIVVDHGNGTVVVVIGDNATGNVTIKVGDKEFNATVVNGTAIVNVTNVTPGIHEVEVIYSGDGNHTNATANANITAPKYDSEIKVEITEVKAGEPTTVTVYVPVNATGTVTVTIDGKTYATDNITDGKAVITTDNLTAGPKTVIVEYSGDGNYSANYTVENFTVAGGKVESEIIVVDHGNGTVVVVIGDNATGNVTIKVGDKEFNATVVNGTAVVNVDNVTPGIHEVEVIYSGDGNHTNATANANITAPRYDSQMNVTVGEAKEGEPIVITVEVPVGATGEVIVNVGGENHTGTIDPVTGKAIVTVDNVSAGNHTIAVEYAGDGNYSANYTISNMVVEKAKVESDLTVVDHGNGTVVVVIGDNATGNVTIKVGDNEFNATVVNGTAVVNVDNVTPGIHEVEVIYSGDGNHTNATANANITAPRYDSQMNVTVGEAKEGEPIVITVEVPVGATGEVIVNVGGENHTGTIDQVTGKAIVTVDNVSPGNHTIAVEYAGDGNYSANYTISNITVEKAKEISEITVVDHGNGTVVIVVGDNATGNITVKVGDKEYNATVINGTAVITLDNVTPGDHEIEIVYSGDGKHSNATANSTINVSNVKTSTQVEVSNINVGEKAIVKVTVDPKATGEITIEIDGVKYTKEVRNGAATFEVENLTAGEKSVFALFNGGEDYRESYASAQFNVSKVKTSFNVTVNDVHVGENVTVTITLPDDATGQILIDIDGIGYYANVTDGVATAYIPYLPSGTYDVNMTYSGDEKYVLGSNRTSVKVQKLESFVIPQAVNIKVGENEIIKLFVPKDATGNVTLVIDTEEYTFSLPNGALGTAYVEGEKYTVAVSGGNGEITISGLPKGEYFVSVKYNGNHKYLPSTNSTIFTVSKIDTKMDVIDEGNGTVKVILPDDATGNVTVSVDNRTYTAAVENGTATITLNETTPGVHDVEVKYSGDNDYSSKTSNATVDIPKYETPISVSADDIYVDDVAVVTVTVPDDATGDVTIEINGVEYSSKISDGKAIFNVEGLAFGNKTVAVTYHGDKNYLENFTTGQFEVMKRPSTVSAVSKNIKAGKNEVIVASLPSDATGQVLVRINGIGYYGTVENGKANVIVPNLKSGSYTAEVTYEGDEKYLSSNTTTSFKVSPSSTPISAFGDEIDVGEDAVVVIDLPSDATGTVTIRIDGKTLTTDVSDGRAVFVIPGLSEGIYIVNVYYSGDVNYPANETVTHVIVNDNHDRNDTNISAHAGVELSGYPTGNPILIALLAMLSIGSVRFRRFRK
ncbi:Ig-like domain repeat protein [uncultured Methanobrevibacter sp.]|uniref:Ig-like domain repeat protein n=1 Tax=uncultured Methanobrevibacter sp. TaxID=253161 RepID=UPI0026276222|nr:Ig-like domain repeat protein [uncultured Methanobrevibacter sp.]